MRRLIQSLERLFRHRIVYPALKLVFHNRQVELPLNKEKVRSILVLRFDRIGDAVVTLPVLRFIKQQMPHARISVLCSGANREVLAAEASIDHLVVLPDTFSAALKVLYGLRSESFDVVLNFIFNRTTQSALIANIAAPQAVKVGQLYEKYRSFFNAMVDLPRHRVHMTDVLFEYVRQVFGIRATTDATAMYYPINSEAGRVVQEFLGVSGLVKNGFCVLNLSVGDRRRKLGRGQNSGIIRHLSNKSISTVILHMPEDRHEALELNQMFDESVMFPQSGRATLAEVAELLRESSMVVTPDTSIVHFASAVGTPLLGVFASQNFDPEWQPRGVLSESVVSEIGTFVDTIPPQKILAVLESLLGNIAAEDTADNHEHD